LFVRVEIGGLHVESAWHAYRDQNHIVPSPGVGISKSSEGLVTFAQSNCELRVTHYGGMQLPAQIRVSVQSLTFTRQSEANDTSREIGARDAMRDDIAEAGVDTAA
jgi:hypothetical protein